MNSHKSVAAPCERCAPRRIPFRLRRRSGRLDPRLRRGSYRLPQHNYSLPPWVGLAIAVIVCGSAFWKGGREEQVAAGGLMLSWMTTLALRDPRWVGAQWGAFFADSCLLLLLVGLALRTRRYWPLAAAAFQLLCVVIHIARIADPGIRAWAYGTGQIIFSQWVFFSVGVGTWHTWRASRHPAIIAEPNTDPGATRR